MECDKYYNIINEYKNLGYYIFDIKMFIEDEIIDIVKINLKEPVDPNQLGIYYKFTPFPTDSFRVVDSSTVIIYLSNAFMNKTTILKMLEPIIKD